MYKKILLAVDLGEESSWVKALPTAIEYCQAFGAKLEIISVLPDFGMSIVGSYFPADFDKKAEATAKEALKTFVKDMVPEGIAANANIEQGSVYEEIIRTADKIDCDLIIMASHRPELQDYLLGPHTARVVRHANQSVLVVRG